MKRLWSIPIIAVCFYIATILPTYKYAAYFGIPSNFVGVSLKDNIIFFYSIATGLQSAASHWHWWVWAGWVIGVVLIAVLCYLSPYWRVLVQIYALLAILTLLLVVFPGFGTFLAEHQQDFYVPSANCKPIGSSSIYIAPMMSEDTAVFVPVNASNTLSGGFIVKDLTEMGCPIEQRHLGQLTR